MEVVMGSSTDGAGRTGATDDGIRLPKARPKVTVITSMMKEMINRTLAVHTLSALVVWYGQARIGKTTTANYMVNRINESFDDNDPDRFRAIYYEVGPIAKGSGNEPKRGIRSLYQASLNIQMDEGFYTRNPSEALAAQLVHGLRRKRIQLIVVDEAGVLSAGAIRGMTLVRDVAENDGWTLTIVFVGMDDLPQKMTVCPQVHGRVRECCYFEKYDLDTTWALLEKLHPFFAELDAKKSAHRELVKVVHELCGGLPGLMVPFVHQLDYRLSQGSGEPITPAFLRAVHVLSQDGLTRSLRDSARPYKPYGAVLKKKTQDGSGESSTTAGKKKRVK
jgi:hypothetical protein